MNKKRLFLWSLYDFANSIVFINFVLYFATWIVVDGGLSDFWYNATFAITTVLLFFSAPSLAAFTDKHGGRKFFLNISTMGIFASYGLAAILAGFNNPNIFIIAVLFLIGQYFYQLAFIFYNPMIEEIADTNHRARASGIGQFSNALGQVTGLLITLPLSGSRISPLIPSVIIFFVLALPMMIFYKESRPKEKKVSFEILKNETRLFKNKFLNFISSSLATPMLLSFFFLSDAVITSTSNYSIYMERVFSVPDKTKSVLLMAILAMSAIGGILAGWIGDKIGMLKTLKLVLVGWIIAFPASALAPNFTIFIIITILVGTLVGAMWATSRAYISTLLSNDEMGYGFSFYTLFERFSTLFGPLTWGGMIWWLGTAPSSYKITMTTMVIFVIISLIILHYWKRPMILNNK